MVDFEYIDWSAIVLSLRVAIITSVMALPLAIFAGYVLARKTFAGKSFLEAVLHLPMVMPPVTTGYLLLLLFGSKGIIGEPLTRFFGIKIAFTSGAAVLASVTVSFPLIVRSVKIAIELVDPCLEEASRTLGASWWKTFYRITLPLAWPGIVSGFVLAFARSLGEFGATITFAGNIAGATRTIPLAIYSSMQMPGGEQQSWTLVCISIVISLAAILLSEYFNKYRMKKRPHYKSHIPLKANGLEAA
ncbi:molybdate ABC transporter permease subunit [Carboxylicivirga sp. A043]|uniref:molybdate ABC transporter permease subunit n=1 Tax=Carboxylicivirga litoralis TaxID=2816963 RepID=UPI0021CB6B71|nr:molybdate ABC transporter permease subunit [Carboxylicivirga sp. A043]MCU4157136.1 molybdate ABC transporter permease subunit [Carboxylicivirga sp. A043]